MKKLLIGALLAGLLSVTAWAQTGDRVTATGTAGVVAAGSGDGVTFVLKNEGAGTVFLGETGVATTTGFALDTGESITVTLRAGQSLYGITTGASYVVHRLSGVMATSLMIPGLSQGGGDASAANQTTMITSLQIVDNVVFGAGTAAAALRVELPTDGTGVIATVGTITNPVTVTDGAGAMNVICDSGCTGGTAIAHSGALTIGTTTGAPAMFRASAAAPTTTGVVDDDAVHPWALLNGSPVANLAVGGTLVTGSAGLPVAQQGTWTVQPGNTANTTAWLVTGTGGTFPVTATNLDVQIGGSDTLQVQSNSANLATQTTLAAVSAQLPAALGAGGGLKTQIYTSAGVAVDPSTQGTHDTTWGTITSVTGGASLLRSSAAAPADVSADGEAVLPWALRNGSQVVNLAAGGTLITSTGGLLNTQSIVTNAGTFAAQIDGAALTALQLIDNAQTGDSVNYRTSAGATEDETEIKATAGTVYSILVTNTNAAARYFRCYNLTAANTTPGTSTVFFGAAIPGNTAGAGFAYPIGPNGIAFSTALTCTLTTGAADTDVAEVAANEIKWTIGFK